MVIKTFTPGYGHITSNISGLKEFFTGARECFFVKAETREIFHQYSGGGGYIHHRYSLHKQNKVWLLIDAGKWSTSEVEPNYCVDVAGFTKDEAVEFLVQKVLKSEKRRRDERQELRTLLKEVLSS